MELKDEFILVKKKRPCVFKKVFKLIIINLLEKQSYRERDFHPLASSSNGTPATAVAS